MESPVRRLVPRAHEAVRHAVALGLVLTSAAPGCTTDEGPLAPEPRPALEAGSSTSLTFRQVVAGDAHSCGLTTAGAAYCWGDNSSGQLGIDPEAAGTACTGGWCGRPVPVAGRQAFRQLSARDGHTCGVTTNDRLYCWGDNRFGMLGDGTTTGRRRPTRIAPELSFRQVSTGNLHTCAVTTGGAAYCWGHNQAGALGTGLLGQTITPVRVARNLLFGQVSAGYQFTCGVTTDHRPFCWGLNADGQLGIGSNGGPEQCFTGDGSQACATRPTRVAGGHGMREVTTGDGYACGVTTADVALCWGTNADGQLGWGGTDGPELCWEIVPCSLRPARVAGGLSFRQISAGNHHTCGVTAEWAAYCWGQDYAGALGTGAYTGEECPTDPSPCGAAPLRVKGDRLYRQVGPGSRFHTCAVTLAGRAFCWGDNSSGQLGDGTTRGRPTPRPVEEPDAVTAP